nr:hypothetical protein [Tanacetum cinerariifolium]
MPSLNSILRAFASLGHDLVMSDASSAITYTSVYTDSEPWRYYEEDSAETGPLRVIVYGYDGLPIQLVALPSPDYVPGPEHPPSPDYVPGPEHPPLPIEIPYVPEPEYPEYLAPSDDEAPLEDQPLPADASPIVASPDYVADSNPEEDPRDDQAEYPDDGGDGDDEPSDDDNDDDTDDEDPEEDPFEEDDEEEDEEHPASTDSLAVPIVDLVLSAGETEALEADEPTHAPGSPISIPLSQTRLRRARKTVRPEPPMSASMEACIARHVALRSPPLLVPSLPLPFPSPLTTSPTDTGAPLGYRAARIRMRTLLLSTSCRTDIPKADMPPQKRACLTAPTLGFEIGESYAAGAARRPGPMESDLKRCRVEQAGYGITDTDRPDHLHTTMLIDREVMYSREAWAFSMDRSSAIAAYVLEARDPEPQEGPTEAGSSCVVAALVERDADRSRNGTGGRRQMTTPRECSYTDFLKCQPMSFHGTEGVIGLTRWIEKMELVFQISNCIVACQVKFASCTLQRSALTWWNSHMRAVGQDVTYAMPWAALKRMITSKYCPRGEIQKLESEFWNLKVKGLDMLNYIHRFKELALMCERMLPEEAEKEAIEFATEMMDKKMLTHVERQAEHKRKLDDTSRNNQHQQQPFKRNNVARAYTAGPGDKNLYGGIKPLYLKCNYHHDGPCTLKCTNCRKIGHWTCDCKSRPAANNNNNQRAQGNGNQWSRARNGNAMARAYAVGTAGTNPNSNVVTGPFLLNNRYASVLFDTGADRSFVSTTFSLLIDIIPTTLDHGYDVELANVQSSSAVGSLYLSRGNLSSLTVGKSSGSENSSLAVGMP